MPTAPAMSSPQWSCPSLLVVSTPPGPDAGLLRATKADAIVVAGRDGSMHAAGVASLRPDLPVILLADVADDLAIELLAAGADDVLPAEASLARIVLAVRRALARRGRRRETSEGGPPSGVPSQLEAIGRLAAGLGHEFNNLMVVIDGNAELLRDRLPEGHSLRQAAESILAAGHRAATLTRQLLAFGRQQTLLPAHVDLNVVVSEAVASLRASMGPNVEIATQLAAGLPDVRVDAAQLREVLSSLAGMALEAMPIGGTFRVETDLWTVGEEERAGRPWLPPGIYCRLRVSDTGLGVDEQVLPHLFEPFAAGEDSLIRGGGLTLAAVYGIVKQSGGYIWVDSHTRGETTVTILFPPVDAALRAAAAVSQPGSRAAVTDVTPAGQRGARILLVEDIEGVRQILKNLLELHEFSVLPAATGEDALELARTRRFDALVTDVALPGLTGPELARQVRAMHPGMPVLFMSGHPPHAIEPAELERGAFLQKPFSAATLVRRLNDLLDERSRRPQ